MKDKLELTKELENEAMENPIRQNHDYGGDFLDKIRERNKRRKQRKEAIPKFAQEREKALFSIGDRVTISMPIEGEVNRVGTVKQILRSSQWGGNKFLYKVEIDVDGKKETFSIQESAIRPPDEAPEHDKFKTGDQVKILRDEGYEPLDAVVVGVGDRDSSGRVLKYTVRFQYDGKWYKRNAETARLIANPNGHVPLSDGSPDEYADAPDSIREEMSSAHEDISLKPVYSDGHGYFVFPNYEYGVYASENDSFVKYLNDENMYYVVNLFKSTKDKELIPVVRDAVIFAINAKQPDKLISLGLYDYIKENYPKYWANAINKVVIEDRRLYAIPDGKHEEVYDNFKEQILPIIFSYEERRFRGLFLDPHAPGAKGNFGFLLDRLLAGNAPEFQAYLGANLDKLSGSFLFRTKIYTLFPEETKEKILKYLEHLEYLGKDRPESFIEASYYIPEAVADLVFTKTLQGNGSIPTLYKPDEYKLIKILKEKFPQKYDKTIRKTARMTPGLFLNSPFGRDRANYGQEILDAIGNLNRRDFQTWDNQENTLSEEFKKFVYQPGNEDLIKALIDKAVKIDEIESLLNLWPDLADKAKDQGIKMLPVAALRNVENLETAKSMYKALRNDYPVEGLPDEIKISKSIYQFEQRPYVLENETRYTISNNNIDPTPVLYDIGKKLVHAGDGAAHTNVGVSGFTNSWALVSFIKVQEEGNDDFQDTILIEQYQSDYPPVLFHLFSGKGSGEYGTGKDALQKLIRRYGDQEAIQKYIEEITGAANKDKNLSETQNIPEEKLDIMLDSFDWSSRTAYNLNRAGFSRIRDLVQHSKNDLLRMSFFGRKSISEIEKVLSENGLSLKSPDEKSEFAVGDVVRDKETKETGVIISIREDDKFKYKVKVGNYYYYYMTDEIELASNIDPEEIELPIELAPMVKDARTHFEYISKAYPYLAIANTIKTAQALNLPNIYIFADAARYANIENDDKAYKLYEAIPEALGEKIHDHNYDLDMWRIPATDETLEKLYAMTQEATGKSKDYNFSLTPSQNQKIQEERIQEEKRKKQQWQATPEKQKKLEELERSIREKLPEVDIPNFYSPQQALRYLGQKVKGKIVNKKRFNDEFEEISRELGILARASRRKKRMVKLAAMLRKMAAKPWVGGVPSFDWLNHGMIEEVRKKNPKAFDEFIELNSDKFAVWDPIKYLGSGMVGDVWLLPDDKILKIFDAQAVVDNRTDLEKYEQILEEQYAGTADASWPRIYDFGLLEMPSGFYNTRSPSQKNFRYYRPGYVVMEKVNLPKDEVRKYIGYNPSLLEPGFVYDEESDEWTEREYSENEEAPISQEEIPYHLVEEYQTALLEGTYDEFLEKFAQNVFHYIILDMTSVFENRKEEFESGLEEEEEDGEFPDDILDFRDPNAIDYLVDEMTDSIGYSEYYTEESISALERILNLPKDWDKKLARAIANNIIKGRVDLHGENFGFRNGQAVFFDA